MPKLLERNILIKDKWATIVQEQFQTEAGKEGRYVIVERKPALMVIPLVREGDAIYTYLVKQYRYPIAKEVWQIPMGTLEDNVNPIEHARAELEEETGLQTKKITFAGTYYVDPGLSRQQCSVYIAEEITEGGKQKLEESELGMITQRFSLKELESLIEDNKLTDGWIYPAIYFLKQALNMKG